MCSLTVRRIVTVLLPLFAAAAQAQNVNVTVNAAQNLRVVDERVFGVNSTLWDSHLGTAETQSLLANAGVRAIRLPGGSISDEYHWLTNRSRDNNWAWASGFDKSAQLTSNLDAQAFVTVNYGSGTPEEAAAWVAYANAAAGTVGAAGDVNIGVDAPAPGVGSVPAFDWQSARVWANLRAAAPLTTDDGRNFLRLGRSAPFAFRYWEIGNENYGDWEFDLQSPAHSATTYAARAAVYIQKMRAVDATIRIGVVVINGNQYNNWTANMLGALSTLGPAARPDFVIYHRYDQGPGGESDAALLQVSSSWAADATDLRAKVDAAFGTPNNIEILVTENNSVYSNPGKQSTSLVNGIFMADSIGNVMKTEINALMWWDIRNGPPTTANNAATLYGWRTYGDYGIISSQATGGAAGFYETYPTYYAMKLLSWFARGGDTVVSATSSSNLLAVYAVRKVNGALTLLVLNKDPTNTITANFALSGFTPPASARVNTYGKPNDDAARPSGTGCPDISVDTLAIPGANFSATLGSYSMTVLSLGGPSYPAPAVGSSISVQPVSASLTAGGTATFTAGVIGCPTPNYRWQRAPAGSATFTDLADGGAYSGSATTSLSVSATTVAMSGDRFRLAASNATSAANSNAATLTVASAPVPPPPPPAGGGGGGGGRMDLLLIAALGVLLAWRATAKSAPGN